MPKKKQNKSASIPVINHRLSNGLDVFLLPMPGFQEVCGAIATRFGSLYSGLPIEASNPSVLVPQGAAHFLEHRLFDHPKGPVFDRYAARGAYANAYTSYDRTIYYFVAASRAIQNTQLLVDFTQTFAMSEKRVNREKDIIIEELKMYEDSSDIQLHRGLLRLLYPKHPLGIDIAGTRAAVVNTSRELLQRCHETFYHPSNMMLVLAGDFQSSKIIEALERTVSRFPSRSIPTIPPLFSEPNAVNSTRYQRIHMPVAFPMLGHGFRLPASASSDTPKEHNRSTIVYEVLIDLLFSRSGPYYDKMVARGMITPSWDSTLVDGVGYRALLLNAEALKPREYTRFLESILASDIKDWLHQDDLERVKHKMIGLHTRGLELPSSVALDYLENRLDGVDVFDDIEALESVTLEDVKTAYATLQQAIRVRFDVYPLKKKGA